MFWTSSSGLDEQDTYKEVGKCIPIRWLTIGYHIFSKASSFCVVEKTQNTLQIFRVDCILLMAEAIFHEKRKHLHEHSRPTRTESTSLGETSTGDLRTRNLSGYQHDARSARRSIATLGRSQNSSIEP